MRMNTPSRAIGSSGTAPACDGTGPAILLLHGNPTWSYVYRNVIKALRAEARCIAPDYPGFGFSGHPPGYGYTPAEHADWVTALINHLGLTRIILVCHDWGVAIGLSIATQRPQDFAGLVILNTRCWRSDLRSTMFSVLTRMIHEHFCCNRLPVRVRTQTGRSSATTSLRSAGSPLAPSPYGTSTHRVLTAPHAGLATRLSDVATNRHESCGLMGSDFSGRYLQLKKNFFARTVVPNSIFHKEKVTAALVWAMKDPAFGKPRYLDRWRTIFPQAQVETLDNASHYLQEDRPDRIVEAITAQ